MAAPEVVVVQTGTANTASVLAGLRRAGAAPSLTNDPRRAEAADYLVLPGVGSLAPAMERLERDDLVEVLRQRFDRGRPSLAVCLGLQILCAESAESPGVAGLGVIPGRVSRFSDQVVVPQMGWNEVESSPSCRLLRSGYAYFANSFRLVEPPPGWSVALADHGGRFVAALERGAVLACQFHPELSGKWGLALLQRWLSGGGQPC